MSLKPTDKFVITGKELPITIDGIGSNDRIVYSEAGEVLVASDWPSYKKSISDALSHGLIEPYSAAKESSKEKKVIAENVIWDGEE